MPVRAQPSAPDSPVFGVRVSWCLLMPLAARRVTSVYAARGVRVRSAEGARGEAAYVSMLVDRSHAPVERAAIALLAKIYGGRPGRPVDLVRFDARGEAVSLRELYLVLLRVGFGVPREQQARARSGSAYARWRGEDQHRGLKRRVRPRYLA